jgi:NAD(P)-dependent dehydrogenase (short-subunit alcohol dehydrogenase family)
MDATALLRPHLLDGLVVAFGGGDAAPLAPPLAALGAVTSSLPATLDEDALSAAADPLTDVLVHDLRPAFAGGRGDAALRATLDLAWVTVRAVANAAFIPGARGGKVTLIAPRADGSASADVAVAGVRAAAENLARTLSIEWARHGIVTAAIAPGAGTANAEIAALAAYLASPAGDYVSGCRLALGELPVSVT